MKHTLFSYQHKPRSRRSVDILQHYLEDIIYGANDGIVTTFTIISGVEGAKLAPVVVVILGFVNLFADGVSMGASRYLSIRAGAAVYGKTRGIVEPFYHATWVFLAFVIFGLAPLLSFLVPGFMAHRFLISCLLTMVTLFFVGALQFFIKKRNWLSGGVEMLVIGSIAAIIAYGVGYLLKALTQFYPVHISFLFG